MNLLNNVFDTDLIEINGTNKKYLKILLIIVLLIIGLFIIKKDYYYENGLIISDNSMILLVDKNMMNKIKDKKTILVDQIESSYSINKIIDRGDSYYMDINMHVNIENISSNKYKVLMGKERIFEYIIRIIKKVS